MRRFYADRSEYFGDPDFYKVPVQQAAGSASTSPAAATASIRCTPRPATRFARATSAFDEGTETTHFNVVDSEGNAVAVTYTLNNGYGSGVTVPGLGFLLNDEMDDFAAKPGTENLFHLIQGESNAIQPGKRPRLVHDADHRAARWQAVSDAGRARRIAYHQRRAPGASECGRFPHERAGRRGLAAFSSPVDAGRVVRGERHFSRHGETPARHGAQGFAARIHVAVVARVEAILNEGGWLQGAADPRGNGKAEGY